MLGPRRSRASERFVLALGLVAAAALGAAAFAPGSAPESTARARLAQLAGEVEDAILAEWRRALRELPARLERPVTMLRFGEGTRAPAALEPSSPESAAYVALAADARMSTDPTRALELARAAFAAASGPKARAESTLLLVQLQMAAGDSASVAETWRAARANLEPRVEIAGFAAPIAVFLVAESALDPVERAREASELALAASRRELVLPVVSEPGALDARVELVAERLADAAGDERDSVMKLFEATNALLRAESVARSGVVLDERCEGSGWNLTLAGGRAFASHAATSGGCEGFFVESAELADVLTRAAEPTLPEDFVVDIDGDRGEPLRSRVDLAAGILSFRVACTDVDRWIAREGSRARWLSAGLATLAVLCAVAGFVAARALARERHLSEARAAFVAGVSHELRTPVTSILLLAENLENGRVSGTEATARYHELIRREALRLRRLVDGVLDFSRLERGVGLTVAREPVDVRAWLASVADEARAWATQHDVDLHVDFDTAPESAFLDREALRRALWNLLENALRHSGSKRITLRARGAKSGIGRGENRERVAGDDDDGTDLVLEVEDEGRGVPVARRSAVFEPFARFAEPGVAGTGLGLALVRGIAHAHGGSIEVGDGANGRGARFTLRVPIEDGVNP